MTDNTPPNIQLVQDTYTAFRRGDIDAAIAAMHPDIDWHEAEDSAWHTPGGHNTLTEVLTNVFARIPVTSTASRSTRRLSTTPEGP